MQPPCTSEQVFSNVCMISTLNMTPIVSIRLGIWLDLSMKGERIGKIVGIGMTIIIKMIRINGIERINSNIRLSMGIGSGMELHPVRLRRSYSMMNDIKVSYFIYYDCEI